MLVVAPNSHMTVRVWLNDLPRSFYPEIERVIFTLDNKNTLTRSPREVAIEFSKSTCGPSSYGLLGAKYTPLNTGQLEIQVVISEKSDGKPDWALMPRSDDVRIGLPKQYAQSVLDGALSAKDLVRLGPGTLCFDCAAHGFVGSSPFIFRRLALAVVWLISAEPEETQIATLSENLGRIFM